MAQNIGQLDYDGEVYGGTADTDPNICVSSADGSFTQLGGTIE